MKLIRCQIHVGHLERVLDSLRQLTAGLTVWDAREDSKATNLTSFYRGLRYEVSPPRLILEIVADETWVEDILRVLMTLYSRNNFGDSAVQVFPVEASYHVRTGFMDL